MKGDTLEDKISINSHGFDAEQIEKLLKTFSDIGMIPTFDPDWNIRNIVLSCINSKACLSGMKTIFTIDDIKTKNITAILKTIDWNIKNLLEFQSCLEIDAYCYEPKEIYVKSDAEKRLEAEWSRKYGGEVCDYCGFSMERGHDCISEKERHGETNNKETEACLTVDQLTAEVVFDIQVSKVKVTYTYVEPKDDREKEERQRFLNDLYDFMFDVILLRRKEKKQKEDSQ
ncbi:MAG: hypothetical protein NTU76_03770 [Candidatus Taylorbacteria bacterium]|nr:hypothetical protein [Candidatus Taylorbacteria bacterium]